MLEVAFSPDGKLLASAGADSTIRLWDVATHRPVGLPLEAHEGQVRSVAFSPNGKLLASGGADNTVRLWDVMTGQPVGQPLTGHLSGIRRLAFGPDGKRLASASSDNDVRLWDVATGQPIGQPLTGHTSAVFGVAFSPDGKQLATAGEDQTVRLWDVATGAPIGQPLTGSGGTVYDVAFSPDGKTLVSAGERGTISFWPISLNALRKLACFRANRNLTEAEWRKYLGDEPYQPTCPFVTARQANAYAGAGHVQQAAAAFAQAIELARKTDDADFANHVCWTGSIAGLGRDVLPVCDRAIELAPDDSSRATFRDSRGLARALTGDYRGAADDFRRFVQWSREQYVYERFGVKRERWLAEIEAGRDPFTPEVLEALRNE